MSQNLCANTYKLRHIAVRLSILGVLGAAAVVFGNTSCEDKGIGRPCDVLTEATTAQAVYNAEALECPSRICLKPAVQSGVSGVVDTAPYCSASCSQDSDCDGQVRGNDSLDKRCKQGFQCGIAFVKGKLCCQKLCLCKDFINPAGLQVPNACKDPVEAGRCQVPPTE
jgi:hypothetical protein